MDDTHDETEGLIEEEFLFRDDDGDSDKPRKPRAKKVNPVGQAYYGEKFEAFDLLEGIRDLIPAFKAHFYAERIKDPKMSGKEIINSFNEMVAFPLNRTFFPYMKNVSLWKAKWERDIAEQKKGQKEEDGLMVITPRASVKQILKTRGENGELVLGTGYGDIEAGLTTLAGELTNDAMQMLRDDQEIGEVYDDEVLIKRRNYIVNVFGHVTKLVHGKAALILKASEEKRENAGFLMSLLAKATAGKLSEEEMGALKTTYTVPTVQHNEQVLS